MSAVLAIDTTTRGGSVALARDGVCLGVAHHDPEQGYAESLFPLLDELLATARLAKADVQAVAVARGPGSFTGLRIGIMMAKTLAFARGGQLWTAETLPLLASYALRGGPESGGILALLDAGAGFVYASLLSGADEELRPLVPSIRTQLDEVASWTDPAASSWVVVAGDPDLETRARQVLPPERVGRFAKNEGLAQRLGELASLGQSPAQLVSAAQLVPLYLTPSQAERAHGLDLREAVHRAIPPTGWE